MILIESQLEQSREDLQFLKAWVERKSMDVALQYRTEEKRID